MNKNVRLTGLMSVTFLVAIVMVSFFMLLAFEWRGLQNFKNQQVALASNSGKGVARHIAEALDIRNHQIKLFADDHKDTIAQLAAEPDNQKLHDYLHQRTNRAFPHFFALTIADPKGSPLLDDFDGNVGEICIGQIRTFISSGKRDVLIHPNQNAYHIDLMTQTPYGNVFFASFKPDFLVQALNNAQPPGQQMFLLKQGQSALIEVSSNGVRDKLKRDFVLSKDELQNEIFRQPLEGTHWDLVILQDPEALQAEYLAIATRIGFVLFVLGVLGYLLFRSSRNEQVLLQQTLEAKEQSRLLLKQEDDFKALLLAVLNHEIRTPLNSLQGYLEMLNNSQLTAEQKNQVGKVNAASRELFNIVNSIVDASLLQKDELSLEQTAFCLREVLENTVKPYVSIASKKDLELVFEHNLATGYCVNGVPSRIRQIINILLDNAIKFTPQGQVIVKAVLKQDTLHVTIIDTGIGISAVNQERIFKIFTQVDNGLGRRHGGVGLGAAIANRLVRLMGGEISVDSKPGEGSTFRFSLLLPRTDCPDLQIDAESETGSGREAAAFELNETTVESRDTVALKFNNIVPPESAMQQLLEGLYQSAIMEKQLAEILAWAKTEGLGEWAENLEKAIEDFDFSGAEKLIRQALEK